MSQLPIKKVLVGATIAMAIFMTRLPLPALAATDETAVAAAQSGVGYLAANQNSDGSISGFGGATDWSAITVQAAGQEAAGFNSSSGTSALDFMKTDVPAPAAPATDVERKIIAVADAGQDTTNFGSVNYDSTLAGYHTSQQIGDPTLLNDDIFGVIAASASKNPVLHDTAQDGLDYFLAHQGADGGFSYTTDSCAFCGSDSNDTAAAIIAMQAAPSIGLSNTNLTSDGAKALAYLLSTQQADGGFAYDAFSPSDGSSTAWGLMALNSIGDTVHDQAMLARDWLLANQNSDGGFSYGAFGITASDTYTTAHAIIALLGTTWLLQPSPLHVPLPPATLADSIGSSTTNNTSSGSPTASANTASDPSTAPKTDSPQVLGTKTDTQKAGKQATPNKTKPSQNGNVSAINSKAYSFYGVLALVLAALIWFVLESRKASRRAKHEN